MKKKTLTIVSSCAAIAVCSSLIVGSTYALFTSKDTVNIAVTAGKVAVTAEVGEITTSSTLGTSYAVAEAKGGNLTIDKILPGDIVEFPITVSNESSVDVLYKMTIECTEGQELMSGLMFELGKLVEGEVVYEDYSSIVSYASAWSELTPVTDEDKTVETVYVKISLPIRGDDIDNRYNGLSTKIAFSVEAVQGNAGYTVGEGEEIYRLHTVYDTEGAQAALDNATENDTVFLKAGNYGKLWIRQSSKSVDVTPAGAHTLVERTISNLSIVGEEGTIVEGIQLGSTLYLSGTEEGKINPVTGKPTTYGALYAKYYLDNVTISNLVVKTQIAMTLEGWTSDNYIRGLNVDNCKTVDNEIGLNVNTNKFIDIRGGACELTDVVVTDCAANNRYQGVYLQYANNVTVENCVFDTMTHNAIAVQSGCSGDIVLNGNTVKNDKDRAIRLDNFSEGSVTIINNTFIDSGDGEGQVYKASSLAEGVEFTFEGNTAHTYGFDREIILNADKTLATLAPVDGLTIVSKAEDVQSALDIANVGDKIVLVGDNSLDKLNVNANGVTITGAGDDATISLPTNANGSLVVSGSDVTIADVTVAGGHNASSYYDAGIYVNGKNTTLNNVTVKDSYKGLFTENLQGTLTINDSVLASNVYTLNINSDTEGGNLVINNSTLMGWTSYNIAKTETVAFNGCTFKINEGVNKYNVVAAYNDTVFTDCDFEDGFDARAQITGFNWTFDNCRYNGVLITAENFKEYFANENLLNGCTVTVNGVTLTVD